MMKKALIGAIVAVVVSCGPALDPPETSSPADSGLSQEEIRYMAKRKLVCVRNQSTFPMRVKLEYRGFRLGEISVGPHDYEEEWIERYKFEDSPITAIIDPTGAKEAIPMGFRRLQVVPNGRNIELTVGSREGGLRPFAHSGRAASCDGED